MKRTSLKGMNFDHDFGYSQKKREEEKENELANIKTRAFQTGR